MAESSIAAGACFRIVWATIGPLRRPAGSCVSFAVSSRLETGAGGPGNDKLYGNGGKDRLYGQAGNDRLAGGSNGDKLYGGKGKDTLYGGKSRDLLVGGPQKDTLNGGPRKDTAKAPGPDVLVSIEIVVP